MSLALFEDPYWQNFVPISLTRATFDIKVGAKTFFEEHPLAPETLLTREYLTRVTSERHPNCRVNPSFIDSDTIFVNGLLHPAVVYPDRLLKIDHTFAITVRNSNRLLIARLDRKDNEYLQQCVTAGRNVDVKRLEVDKLNVLDDQDTRGFIMQPWDIIRVLENSLSTQIANMKNEKELDNDIGIKGSNPVAVSSDASIEAGTMLDVRKGGIYIGPGAHVETSRIVGPTYVGGMSQIKHFSIIESSYIGYNCRISGEIAQSIISDFTNKSHAGFIGHSYVGEWVNIGAMSTTSDLKMTYGNIKMNNVKDNNKIDTGQNKIGSFFADMVKTSIGTLIYSGRRIGVSSHLHGLVTRDVPSFTIYGTSIGARNVELELDSIIETQKKMMMRRNQTMSKSYEQMIKDIFDITSLDRKQNSVRTGKFTL